MSGTINNGMDLAREIATKPTKPGFFASLLGKEPEAKRIDRLLSPDNLAKIQDEAQLASVIFALWDTDPSFIHKILRPELSLRMNFSKVISDLLARQEAVVIIDILLNSEIVLAKIRADAECLSSAIQALRGSGLPLFIRKVLTSEVVLAFIEKKELTSLIQKLASAGEEELLVQALITYILESGLPDPISYIIHELSNAGQDVLIDRLLTAEVMSLLAEKAFKEVEIQGIRYKARNESVITTPIYYLLKAGKPHLVGRIVTPKLLEKFSLAEVISLYVDAIGSSPYHGLSLIPRQILTSDALRTIKTVEEMTAVILELEKWPTDDPVSVIKQALTPSVLQRVLTPGVLETASTAEDMLVQLICRLMHHNLFHDRQAALALLVEVIFHILSSPWVRENIPGAQTQAFANKFNFLSNQIKDLVPLAQKKTRWAGWMDMREVWIRLCVLRGIARVNPLATPVAQPVLPSCEIERGLIAGYSDLDNCLAVIFAPELMKFFSLLNSVPPQPTPTNLYDVNSDDAVVSPVQASAFLRLRDVGGVQTSDQDDGVEESKGNG